MRGIIAGRLGAFQRPRKPTPLCRVAEREGRTTKRFEIAALILAALGALFLLGAVGNADFYGEYSAGDYIRIAIGLVLQLPIIGAGIKQYKEENEDTDTETEEDYHDV